jgi:hypothetical protein
VKPKFKKGDVVEIKEMKLLGMVDICYISPTHEQEIVYKVYLGHGEFTLVHETSLIEIRRVMGW